MPQGRGGEEGEVPQGRKRGERVDNEREGLMGEGGGEGTESWEWVKGGGWKRGGKGTRERERGGEQWKRKRS